MKQYILVNDLLELTEAQRSNLRSLWEPKENDRAVAFICSNAETDEYEAIPFTIGKIDCNVSAHGRCNLSFRSYKVVDENLLDELSEIDDQIEDNELEYITPDDYFSYQDSLPLLNIGQMIDILSKSHYSDSDFFIGYDRETGEYRIGTHISDFASGNYEGISSELCDALWTIVKSII